MFNEIIPDPIEDYFAELGQASESREVVDYALLVGPRYLNDMDGLVYETTCVMVECP